MRLDTADVRIDESFQSLAAAKHWLTTEAKADYEMLQASINDSVAKQATQALVLRTWAKQQTDVLRTSLNKTQAHLNIERKRLQSQNDRDMVDMKAKIHEDIAAFNVSFRSMMIVDLKREHSLLTTRESDARKALAFLSTRMLQGNTPLQLQYKTMRDLRNSNDVMQRLPLTPCNATRFSSSSFLQRVLRCSTATSVTFTHAS